MKTPSEARLWAWLLALGCVAAATVSHAQTLTFPTDPASGEFVCPSTLLVDVTVDGAIGDLRGASLVLGYDPSKIRPVSITAGPLFEAASCSHFLQWLDPLNLDGSLEIDAALLGCSVSGPGGIVTIEFEGVGNGVSALTCIDSTLRNSANQTIPVSCFSRIVKYSCPVGIDSPTWGHVKALFE